MIKKLSTAGKWAAGGSVLLASATLLSATAGANPTGGEETTLGQPIWTAAGLAPLTTPTDDLTDALKAGRSWVTLRYRYENVDQDGMLHEAEASTLQTRLGYESGEWNNLTGLLEFSDVSRIGPDATDYNDTFNGKTDYPVVADPKRTQVNQAYAKYSALWGGDLKVGRQRIKLDNDRFVGNVGWRQTEMTYDAATYLKPDLAGLALVYGYIRNINTITGGNLKTNSHVLNVSHTFGNIGKLTGYGYYLDVDAAPGLSTMTGGARFAGEHEFSGNFAWSLLYEAEYAWQTDVEDNPQTETNVPYLHASIGGKVSGVTAKVGYEELGGDLDTTTGASFQTPLATKHAFNGWADQFLNTPAGGLRDGYFLAGYDWEKLGVKGVYHVFDYDKGGPSKYGKELDLMATYKTPWGVEIGVKYADFDGEDAAGMTDVEKFWFWLGYSF